MATTPTIKIRNTQPYRIDWDAHVQPEPSAISKQLGKLCQDIDYSFQIIFESLKAVVVQINSLSAASSSGSSSSVLVSKGQQGFPGADGNDGEDAYNQFGTVITPAPSASVNLGGGGISGILSQVHGGTNKDLSALTGIVATDGAGNSNVRTIAAGTGITVTNGNGGSANPTVAWNLGASGQTLAWYGPASNQPPSSGYMTFNTRNGHLVLEATAGNTDTAIFAGVFPRSYQGGNIVVTVHWMAKTATSGTIGWDASFERDDVGEDYTTDSWASAQTLTAATVPGSSGTSASTSVTVTAGANTDSVAAGDPYRIRIRRLNNDTATGNAQFIAVELKEA